jgi:signal transduction histidine kinase
MSEEHKNTGEHSEVVYRRLSEPEKEAASRAAEKAANAGTPAGRRLAPTLRPLLVGFILLLVLIGLLGFFSKRELETVEVGTSLFENQYANKNKLLLNLHAAAIRLDTEARLRAASETRGELTTPFELPLHKARGAVEEQLAQLDRMPFAQQENWHVLRERLARFLESTKDLNTFSLEGFPQFRDVESQIEVIETELNGEPQQVAGRIEALRNESARRITFWWVTALLIGVLVIAATLWEVQRRFRHEQQSLDEARRERQFSTQMLEGMVSAVAAIDAHAHIRSANAAFFEIFPQASVGISVFDTFAAPEAKVMLEAAVAEPVKTATYRGRWLLGAGDASGGAHERTFDLYSSPLEIDNEHGQIVTLVDVSAAVESEAVMRRNEALAAVGQASAQVAHEIKNPLGSIRLGVSMLRDMTKDKEAISTIDLVERGIDHLNKLVIDVTQFSRQKPLARTEFDLHRLLDESLELVSDRVREKQTRIEKHFSPQALRGQWDEDQLRQVFVNLLANAIDASRESGAVSISTQRINADPSHSHGTGNGEGRAATAAQELARITVADEGAGMDEATRARIFEPFFTTKKRGTGLGLAIVKQIVERHGGAITVNSDPGKGARFIIDLPLKSYETETGQSA